MHTDFVKYHGTGNDFVLFDNREGLISPSAHDWFADLCHRRFGIGADGVMLLENHDELDFLMRYYNADGHPSSMCGNGARCIMRFAKSLGVIAKDARFEGPTGQHYAGRIENEQVSLALGEFAAPEELTPTECFIDTGSPHFVRLLDGGPAELQLVDVNREGRDIREQSRWGEGGTNANFFVIEDAVVHMRTYERGVEAETWSCGTGAVATALAAWQAIGTPVESPAEIVLNTPGGMLKVSRDEKSMVWLSGPVVRVFEGRVKYVY